MFLARSYIAGKTKRVFKESFRFPRVSFRPYSSDFMATQENLDAPSVPPPGYSVLREGEGAILQHGNDVFYNKAQVVNRDISIAVLRTFVDVRNREFEEEQKKKANRKFKRIGQDEKTEELQAEGGVDKEINDGEQEPLSTRNEVSEEVPEVGATDDNTPTDISKIPTPSVDTNEKFALSSAHPIRVLEGLAASGLRAIRYAKEINGIGSVVALDNDKRAVEACHRNIQFNGPSVSSMVEAHEADARVYMLTHEKEFDAVDLDPYGSPSIFLDSAVQSVADGGLLLCTATDMAVLCGNNGEVCYSKYGGYPLRAKYCHEMALRILLASIESHANRYKRHIVPVLSLSIDFYIRVFVRIYTSANAVKASPSKLCYVFQCVGCDSFHLQPLGRVTQNKSGGPRYLPGHGPVVEKSCSDCGKSYNLGGPMWAAPIHDADWLAHTLSSVKQSKQLYPAYDKVHSILTAASEELHDIPLYISLHSLSSTLKCTPPSGLLFKSAVINAGYRISASHANPLALKTDAPMDVLWDIMRCWVKGHPVKPQPSETSGFAILAKEPKFEANFSRASSALSRAQVSRVPRFLPNPEQYWGPKPRAGRNINSKHGPSTGEYSSEAPNKRSLQGGDEPDEKKLKPQD